MAGPIRISILANGRQARAEAVRTASSYDRLGKRASRAGRLLGAAFAIDRLARVAVAVGRVGATYVSSLNKIQALTGSTDRQMSRLANRVESQAGVFAKFGQTTGDAAAGMVELTKSGLSAQKALAAIRGTMTLAKAGELEVAEASTLVANTLNTFGLKAKAAGRIANGLANAANISSADVTDLAESFKYAAPLAAKAGVSLAQTNAILAELSNQGIKASQAGTSLRGILLALQAPSTAGGMWLDELGVKVYGAGGQMRDFGDVIEDMRTSLAKLSQEDQNFALKSIFGRNSITGAQVLIKGGSAALDQYTAGVKRAGAATKLARSASKGLAGTIAFVKAAATSTAQSLYRIYSPSIDGALRKVIDFASQNKKVLVPALVGATAATVAFTVAVGVVAAVTSPVILLGAAVAGLGAATAVAYQRSERFRGIVAATGQVIETKVVPAIRAFGGYVTGTVIPAVQRFGDYLIGTTIPAISRTAQTVSQRLQPIAAQLAETFRNDIRPTLAQVVAKFHEWQPGLKRAAETTGRLYAKLVILEATIAGKVVPVLIRFAGVVAHTNIPIALKAANAFIGMAAGGIQMANMFIKAGAAAARFAAAVRAKIGEAARFIAGIPGRARAALGDLSGVLAAAGSALIGGFISGITSRIGDVEGTLRGLTGKLTSWKGPPAKDRRLLRPAGQLLMAGLVKGLKDGSDGVRTFLERITRLIESKLDGKKLAGRRKALIKSLRDERALLIANGKAQDKNNQAIEKAVEKYRQLKQTAAQFAASIKSGFVAFGSVVGLGTTGDSSLVTLPALLSQLTARATVAQQFATVIASLRDKLNKTSLGQLLEQASSGDLEGALATAQAIATGGQGAIQQINQLTAQIAQAGADLGEKMRLKFYGHGIRVAQGVIDGLKRREKQLDNVADRLAKRFVRQVQAGLPAGQTHASSRAATPARDAFIGGASMKTGVPPTTVKIEFTAQQLSEIEKGRKVQISLDAYHGAGGRAKVRTP